MEYYSTRKNSAVATLEEAVKNGMAPDKGLYMPASIPVLTRAELEQIRDSKSLADTGLIISRKLFGEDVPDEALEKIVSGALNFETPLAEVSENIYSLELFHGPTLAFKDVGARFMARLLQYYNKSNDEPVHVLVATSGDTGSAVANGFLDMDGIAVHVLYPSGQVSELQEKQFTTLGSNITALEVDGTFDDCQALVKDAFADDELRSKIILTSANSINLARFLPQSFYYFRAWSQLNAEELVISVPSGNYGNLTAGLVAREMGLPVNTFIAASNANDVIPEYLETGEYKPRPSVQTIANAMDVGAPSNFERILGLFGNNHDRIVSHIHGYRFDDTQIRKIIKEVFDTTGYILDPHGACGYESARDYLSKNKGLKAVFLETAHPAKFPEVVNEIIGKEVEIPERLQAFAAGKKESLKMSGKYEDFREYLSKL
jgi:threonine synthase